MFLNCAAYMLLSDILLYTFITCLTICQSQPPPLNTHFFPPNLCTYPPTDPHPTHHQCPSLFPRTINNRMTMNI